MSWYWVAAIVAVAVLGLLSRRGERPDSKHTRSGGAPLPPPDIDALLRTGRKIEAIKRYRSLHGVDLKHAKDAIEARARELDQ
jgi:ribosomal protein L7/L12